MTHSAGTRLGPYEILSALGAGGMGEVYKARDSRLERTDVTDDLKSYAYPTYYQVSSLFVSESAGK